MQSIDIIEIAQTQLLIHDKLNISECEYEWLRHNIPNIHRRAEVELASPSRAICMTNMTLMSWIIHMKECYGLNVLQNHPTFFLSYVPAICSQRELLE